MLYPGDWTIPRVNHALRELEKRQPAVDGLPRRCRHNLPRPSRIQIESASRYREHAKETDRCRNPIVPLPHVDQKPLVAQAPYSANSLADAPRERKQSGPQANSCGLLLAFLRHNLNHQCGTGDLPVKRSPAPTNPSSASFVTLSAQGQPMPTHQRKQSACIS